MNILWSMMGLVGPIMLKMYSSTLRRSDAIFFQGTDFQA